MINFLLFSVLSLATIGVLKLIKNKKSSIKPSTLTGLFFIGIFLSIPFVLIEHLAFNLKYYLVILAFLAVELIFVSIEHQWEYLHNLIHHNIKELRLLSFFIVSLGFTYSELSFYIFHNGLASADLIKHLPLKALFALSTHTILTSSAAILTVTESIVEHVILFLVYYLRLIFISVSHYLYAFFDDNKISYLIIPLLAYNLYLLFKHKRYLDRKDSVIA